MNYSNFFVLDHGWATRYYWYKSLDYDIKKDEIKKIKKQKIRFGLHSGTTPGDIIGGTPVLNFYSENFVRLLKENKIKSFKAYPVIFDSKYNIQMKYYYLDLTSKVSEIISTKGKYNIHFDDKGKRSLYGRNGLYFNLKEWNGNDIFGIKDTLHVIVTKRLKDLIEKTKLKNVVFTNVEKYSFGVYE